MKNKICIALLLAVGAAACHKNLNEQASKPIFFGEIKPNGWLKEQMTFDLTEGFVGNLDQLVPELIIDDDIYGADRMTKLVKSKDVGATVEGNADWQVQFLWWNSETQSNWWDGFIRNAILTQETKSLEKVKMYIAAKLATQDEDGYMGVYAKDLRYKHSTENGELWAQASLFRGLLAFFEYSEDQKVLLAIEKAVKLTMESYPINASQPFNIKNAFAGVGHGLTYIDVLHRLFEITGNSNYIDYALFLFEDYNQHVLPEADIQTKNLLDSAYKFTGHGVHSYEHLRALVMAAEYSKKPLYKQALQAYLQKLETLITPSGAPIGDEWILGKTANADHTGYEFCSLHELLDSYTWLLAKTGNSAWADRIEWLLFNAAQGAKNPNGKSIAYCKTDNSYFMQGALERENIEKTQSNRFKYSPVHQDVAVCCVPNAGRIYPYYVKSMWNRTAKGFQLQLFGPSTFSTSFNGQSVTIEQETNYPFDFSIHLKISLEHAQSFELAIRKPNWASGTQVKSDAERRDSLGYLFLDKKWKTGDEIHVQFTSKPRVNVFKTHELFVSYGPLVFARPIEATKLVTKSYNISGFEDLFYDSDARFETKWMMDKTDAHFVVKTVKLKNPWLQYQLLGSLVDDMGEKKEVVLFPMAGQILRQVTFPIAP